MCVCVCVIYLFIHLSLLPLVCYHYLPQAKVSTVPGIRLISLSVLKLYTNCKEAITLRLRN